MTSVQNLNIIKQNDKDTAWEIGHADSENAWVCTGSCNSTENNLDHQQEGLPVD